jgi:Uma2 family endonuclease
LVLAAVHEPAHRVHYTFADHVAFERASNVKYEFLNGQIYAMAGGTPEHAALTAAVSGLLFAQLRGKPCRVFSSDLRVQAKDLRRKCHVDAQPGYQILRGSSGLRW